MMKLTPKQKKILLIGGGTLGVSAIIWLILRGSSSSTSSETMPVFLPAGTGNFDPYASNYSPVASVTPATPVTPTGGVDPLNPPTAPLTLPEILPSPFVSPVTTTTGVPISTPSQIITPLSDLDTITNFIGGNRAIAQQFANLGINASTISDFQAWSGVQNLQTVLGHAPTADDARRILQGIAQVRLFGHVNALTGGDTISGEAIAIKHYTPGGDISGYVKSVVAQSGDVVSASKNLIKAGAVVEDVASAMGVTGQEVVNHINAQNLGQLSGAQIVSAAHYATSSQLQAGLQNLSINQLRDAAKFASPEEIKTAIPLLTPQQRTALGV